MTHVNDRRGHDQYASVPLDGADDDDAATRDASFVDEGGGGGAAGASQPRDADPVKIVFGDGGAGDEEGARVRQPLLTLPTAVAEAQRLWQLGGPLLVQNVLSFSLSVTPLAFIGHLDDAVALSGVVLACSVYNITGFSIMCGLAAGSETLCGQAYGARQYRVLGGVALRALCVCLAAALPVVALWTSLIGPLLLFFGQKPAVVAVAARFLRQVRPALAFAALSEVLKRYLLAQRVVMPGMIATAITTALAPVYCYVLVFGLQRGVDGAGAAFVLSIATNAALLLLYVGWRDGRAARRGDRDATFVFSSAREALRAAFSGWFVYLKFASSALLQMWAEWAFYEFAILIAGASEHGEVEGGAAGLCFQVSALVFMSAMALGSSANTRVANELGAGRARAARRAAAVAMAMTLLMQGALVALMVAARGPLLSAFTNSAVVKAAALAAWGPLAASILSDAANCILSAVLRGSGRQALGAAINVAGYWLLGMPLCLALGRSGGLWGLWAAIAIASTAVAGAQALVIARLDWRAEVERAAALAASQARAAEEEAAAAGLGVAADGYGLAAVREEEGGDWEEEEEEDGGESGDDGARRGTGRRDQGEAGGAAPPPPLPRRPPPRKARPAAVKASSLAPASSRELPLSLHAPASRAPSSAFSIEEAGSFTSAAGGGR